MLVGFGLLQLIDKKVLSTMMGDTGNGNSQDGDGSQISTDDTELSTYSIKSPFQGAFGLLSGYPQVIPVSDCIGAADSNSDASGFTYNTVTNGGSCFLRNDLSPGASPHTGTYLFTKDANGIDLANWTMQLNTGTDSEPVANYPMTIPLDQCADNCMQLGLTEFMYKFAQGEGGEGACYVFDNVGLARSGASQILFSLA